MKLGIFTLVLAYMLSQFYRAFLAVLAPVLKTDIGASPEDLSLASGLWFLAFALMQLPVGWALDKIGPRFTASVLLALGGAGGAVVFALAQNPTHITISMVMIGIGCAPVLMASYYIFARSFSPAVFATLAGAVIGFGSLGNIASSLPMTRASEIFGWRETVMALAGVTLIVALAIIIFVKDPPKRESDVNGSVLDLLKMPALWLIFPMMTVNYAAAAGIRGLWIGPYLTDIFHVDADKIGQATLIMGVSMAIGNFAYGPLDRVFRTRKWVVIFGNFGGATALLVLYFNPASGIWLAIWMMAAIGLFGSSFAVLMSHARSFFPPHLMGRGVTLLNLFGIGGAGILQSLSGRVYQGAGGGIQAYQSLFLFFMVLIVVGVVIYLFSQDRTD